MSLTQARTGFEDRTPPLPTLTATVGAEAAYTIPQLKPVRYYELTVTAFEKNGWVWGGDAWSGNIDYMHFSYNGR